MSTERARRGPGRPPKADEIKMIERMDAVAAPSKIWQLLYDRCKEGDTQALKTWLSYRYGQPRTKLEMESVQVTEEHKPPVFKVVLPENAYSLKEEEEEQTHTEDGRRIIKVVTPEGFKE